MWIAISGCNAVLSRCTSKKSLIWRCSSVLGTVRDRLAQLSKATVTSQALQGRAGSTKLHVILLQQKYKLEITPSHSRTAYRAEMLCRGITVSVTSCCVPMRPPAARHCATLRDTLFALRAAATADYRRPCILSLYPHCTLTSPHSYQQIQVQICLACTMNTFRIMVNSLVVRSALASNATI